MVVKTDFFMTPHWHNVRWNKTVVMVSGAFDPIHIGHLQYLIAASNIDSTNNIVVAVVNGDGFLQRKRQYSFMPQYDRVMIVDNIKGIDYSLVWDDETQLVDGAINLIKPNVFAKGGKAAIPSEEQIMCDIHNVEVRYSVGGANKLNSSSELLENFRKLQTTN